MNDGGTMKQEQIDRTEQFRTVSRIRMKFVLCKRGNLYPVIIYSSFFRLRSS